MAGDIDIVINGVSISTKRNLSVNFTIPYSNSGIRILANKKLAGHFTDVKQFNQSKVTVAVRKGSHTQQLAEQQFPLARLQVFDCELKMLEAIR